MIESILKNTNNRMNKSITALINELKRVRTGRASLSLLDGIKVDYYGVLTQLNKMATLSIPDSKLIIIQPWDSSSIKFIEKAIMQSDLGLVPTSNDKVIKVPIPALTEERRKKLVKIVHKICEESKVSIRNIRRDSNESLKKLKKNKDISEDECFKFQDKIQNITNEYIHKVNIIEKEKVKEILEF